MFFALKIFYLLYRYDFFFFFSIWVSDYFKPNYTTHREVLIARVVDKLLDSDYPFSVIPLSKFSEF